MVKFIKNRDSIGAARNTLRAYTYHLKLYFEFLKQLDKDYLDISIDDMANFVGWLQQPVSNLKVKYM